MRVRVPPARQDRDVVQRPSMPDSDSGDPGSTPGIPTKRIALSSNRLGRHPFTVKTYGFEPRRRDQLGHSAAASTPDFDSGGPGSSPGTPTQWSFGRRGVCVGLKIHRTWFNSARLRNMVTVAQLVRAPDCGSGGQGFEPLLSHQGNIAQWQSRWLLTIGS